MKTYVLEISQFVPHPIQEVFSFLGDPGSMELFVPLYLDLHFLTLRPVERKKGATFEYTLKIFGFKTHWTLMIQEYQPPKQIVGVQVKGPCVSWRHTQNFTTVVGGTIIEDRVEYVLPLGIVGQVLNHFFIRRELDSTFNYRSRVLEQIFA